MADLDPRQSLFLKYYLDPSSPTFSNALGSAEKAGYSREYSENILQEDLKWLNDGISEFLGKPTDKKNLIAKAKKKADKLLDSDDDNVVAKVTTFLLKTDSEFSEKSEHKVELPTPILGALSKERGKENA